MIRIAAAGDLHFGEDSAGTLRPHLTHLPERADVLLIAGDLTRIGTPGEARVLADELRDVGVPVVAVLGNHDHQSDQQDQVSDILGGAGIHILEGGATVVEAESGARLGIAGTKGFGGGFAGACGSDFGEREMKAFIEYTKRLADGLESALLGVEADRRVALLHYSPVAATLQGERLEIYPFLGSYLLAEAVDRGGADVAIHGHAHHGSEKGVTEGGVPVRNVAQPVIGKAYRLYCLTEHDDLVTAAEPEMAAAPQSR